MNRAKSLTLGILTGGIVSSVVVLLSAPYSGKEFRSRLKDKKRKMNSAIADLKGRMTDVKQHIQETAKTSNVIVKNVAQDISQSVKEWKQSTAPHQQAIQSHLSKIQDSLTNLEQQVQNIKDEKE
jgi:gas vesicle protein